ncbi:MAG: type II secretion system protein [Bacilli bacterium]|nr:type II secretion system protein [Bacilli bacterium]
MKNKKGFIFVETIVILTVVALSLSIVLATYSLITRKSKIKEYYNLSSDLYLIYNISQLGTTNRYNYGTFNDFWINKNTCSDKIGQIITNCSDLFTNNNIQNIGIFTNIDDTIKNNTYSLDTGTIEFLNTLKKYYDEERKQPIKYMVARFYRNREYYYAALKVGGENE